MHYYVFICFTVKFVRCSYVGCESVSLGGGVSLVDSLLLIH